MTFDAEMVQQVQRQADFLELRARQLELDAHHLRERDGEGAGFHQQREADAIRALLADWNQRGEEIEGLTFLARDWKGRCLNEEAGRLGAEQRVKELEKALDAAYPPEWRQAALSSEGEVE